MNRASFTPACVLVAILAFAGLTLPAQSPGDQTQYGGPSSYGSGSYGGSSGSYGGSGASSRSSSSGSSSSYGSRSSSSYGTSRSSRSSYGGSSRTSSSSRSSYGSSRSSSGSSGSSYGSSRSSSSYGSYGYGGSYSRSSYGGDRRSSAAGSYRQRGGSGQQGGGPGRYGYRQIPQPTYARGQVLTSGGAPVAGSLLRMNCGGASYAVGYTDRRGRYSIAVNRCYSLLGMAGARLSRVIDPYNAWFIDTSLSGCWLEAVSPGYGLARLELGILRSDIKNNLGSLVLDPLTGQADYTVSIDTLMAPPEAKKAYTKGLREMQKRYPNYRRAASHFLKAVEIHPEYAPAWSGLGEAYIMMDEFDKAENAFTKAIEADPNSLAPYESMIQMATESSDWKGVSSLAEKYLELSPAASRVRYYRALASYNLKNLSETEAIVRKMKDFGEMDLWPTAYYIMGSVHALRGEYEEGAKQYEAFLAHSPGARPDLASKAKRAIYEWSKLEVIEPREVSDPDGGAEPSLTGDPSGTEEPI